MSRFAIEATSLVSSVILARLLAPREFGEAAMAIVVWGFALGLPAAGIAGPLVQRRSTSPDFVRSGVAVAIVFGFGMTAVALAFAAATKGIFGDRSATLVAMIAPAFLLTSLAAVGTAQLQRRLDFRRLALIEVAAVAPSIAVAVGCAAAGVGSASLIAGFLTQAALLAAFALGFGAPGLPRWRQGHMREIWRFGGTAALANGVYILSRSVDYAFLAARLDARSVGLYYRAYQLAIDYQGKVSGVLSRVAFPVLSRSEDLEALRVLRAQMVRVQCLAVFPLLALLIALAPSAVPLIYGEAWVGAVVPAQVLAIAGFFASASAGTGPVLMALGRPRSLLLMNVVTVALLVPAVAVTAPSGLVSVCVAVVAVAVVTYVGQQVLVVQRLIGLRFGAVLRADVGPAALTSLLLIAVTLPLEVLARDAEVGRLTTVVAGGLLGIAVYAAGLRLAFPRAWEDVRRVVSRVPR